MLQLNPPLIRIIVGGPGWDCPTGRGVANFIEPGHLDDDIIWIIDLDDGGQTWCVPNRYVRAPANITQGRKAAPCATAAPARTDPAESIHTEPIRADAGGRCDACGMQEEFR